jgi:glycosyltransferase involved in cell wall biosynthesis
MTTQHGERAITVNGSARGPSSGPRPYLSVVLPVYNEEENLIPLADKLFPVMSSVGRSYEVIFVNAGSTDRSADLLGKIKSEHPHVRLLHLDRNHGLTTAFDAGIKAARGEYVVTLDSDLQNDPEDIPLLLKTMYEGKYDAVIGWRKNRHDRLVKRISSRIANFVRNRFAHETVPDSACSLKLFRRECLSKIKLYNGLHRFFPVLLAMEGYTVGQVVVKHHPRLHGKSKYGVWNRVFRAFVDLLAVVWMQKRALRYKVTEDDG